MPNHTKLNITQVKRIRALRSRFTDVSTIASALNVSRSTVNRVISGVGAYKSLIEQAENMPKRGKKPIASQEQIKKVMLLRNKGLSYWDISLVIDLSASTIARIINKQGGYA